jgi:hypothetical protein
LNKALHVSKGIKLGVKERSCNMKVLRILLHGFVLFITNFIGIFLGLIVYHLARPANQIAIQLPIAAIVSITLFLAWSLLIRRIHIMRSLALCDIVGIFGTFVASLIFAPLIFVPLHYFTQGYLTGVGNLVAILLFQLPVNGIVVVAITIIRQYESRANI